MSDSHLYMERPGFEAINDFDFYVYSITYEQTYPWFFHMILGDPIRMADEAERMALAYSDEVLSCPSSPRKVPLKWLAKRSLSASVSAICDFIRPARAAGRFFFACFLSRPAPVPRWSVRCRLGFRRSSDNLFTLPKSSRFLLPEILTAFGERCYTVSS